MGIGHSMKFPEISTSHSFHCSVLELPIETYTIEIHTPLQEKKHESFKMFLQLPSHRAWSACCFFDGGPLNYNPSDILQWPSNHLTWNWMVELLSHSCSPSPRCAYTQKSVLRRVRTNCISIGILQRFIANEFLRCSWSMFNSKRLHN